MAVEWLDAHVKVALETPFYCLEDDQTHIPHFPKVSSINYNCYNIYFARFRPRP